MELTPKQQQDMFELYLAHNPHLLNQTPTQIPPPSDIIQPTVDWNRSPRVNPQFAPELPPPPPQPKVESSNEPPINLSPMNPDLVQALAWSVHPKGGNFKLISPEGVVLQQLMRLVIALTSNVIDLTNKVDQLLKPVDQPTNQSGKFRQLIVKGEDDDDQIEQDDEEGVEETSKPSIKKSIQRRRKRTSKVKRDAQKQ